MLRRSDLRCNCRVLVLPFVLKVKGFKGWNFEVQTTVRMNDDFIALADDIAEGVAASGEQIAVLRWV